MLPRIGPDRNLCWKRRPLPTSVKSTELQLKVCSSRVESDDYEARHKNEHGLYKRNPENHAQLIFGLRPVSPKKDH
jgi:hypothetical protein